MTSTNTPTPPAQDTGAKEAGQALNPPNSPPPTKQSLNHWWKAFSKKNKKDEEKGKLPPTSVESGASGDGTYNLSSQSPCQLPGLLLDRGSWGPSILEQPALHPHHNGAAQAISSNSFPVSMPQNASELKARSGDSQGVKMLSQKANHAARYRNSHSSFKAIKNTSISPLLSTTSEQLTARSFANSSQGAFRKAIEESFPGNLTGSQSAQTHTYCAQGIEPNPSGIFGVPLQVSIKYANVAISLTDNEGKSFIYGYVPIVVAKCGVYLKEQATEVKGIFRLSGSAKRIKELQIIFDSPTRYGKGLDWAGFTVHDAANVLRRYLNLLPEPIVPLSFYEKFRDPIRHHQREAVGNPEADDIGGFDDDEAIKTYQELITQIPPLNRQLLLYILDLLAVFASKSEFNAMPSANLAAIFQPGTLSHIKHDLEPAEYRLSQDVLIFLIENQDNFLIGMRGTAADEKTVKEVQSGGTPPIATPVGVGHHHSKSMVGRSSSNASAGAESVRKYGGLRRNVSVSSKHSSIVPSPVSASPGASSGGVHRSNTLPSKKSPALPSGRFNRSQEPTTPTATTPQNPATATPRSNEKSPTPGHAAAVESVARSDPTAVPQDVIEKSEQPSPSKVITSGMEKQAADNTIASPTNDRAAETPPRERSFGGLFSSKSPASEGDKKDTKQQNRLRKKRIPGSTNPSAHSSTHSLHVAPNSVNTSANPSQPVTTQHDGPPGQPVEPSTEAKTQQSHEHEPVVLAQTPSTLKPESSQPNSRRTSVIDQPTKAVVSESGKSVEAAPQSNSHLAAPPQDSRAAFGSNQRAGISNTSIGSSSLPQKTVTSDSQRLGSETASGDPQSNPDSTGTEAEKRGPLGWLKSKVREVKEERKEKGAERDRAKSPPPAGTSDILPNHNLASVVDDKSTATTSPSDHPTEPAPNPSSSVVSPESGTKPTG